MTVRSCILETQNYWKAFMEKRNALISWVYENLEDTENGKIYTDGFTVCMTGSEYQMCILDFVAAVEEKKNPVTLLEFKKLCNETYKKNLEFSDYRIGEEGNKRFLSDSDIKRILKVC